MTCYRLSLILLVLIAAPLTSSASPLSISSEPEDLFCDTGIEWVRTCPAAIDHVKVRISWKYGVGGPSAGFDAFADIYRRGSGGGLGMDFEIFRLVDEGGVLIGGDGTPGGRCGPGCIQGGVSVQEGARSAWASIHGSFLLPGHDERLGIRFSTSPFWPDPVCYPTGFGGGSPGGIGGFPPNGSCFSTSLNVLLSDLGERAARFTFTEYLGTEAAPATLPTIPEPSSLLLFGSALGIAAWRRGGRRRVP